MELDTRLKGLAFVPLPELTDPYFSDATTTTTTTLPTPVTDNSLLYDNDKWFTDIFPSDTDYNYDDNNTDYNNYDNNNKRHKPQKRKADTDPAKPKAKRGRPRKHPITPTNQV